MLHQAVHWSYSSQCLEDQTLVSHVQRMHSTLQAVFPAPLLLDSICTETDNVQSQTSSYGSSPMSLSDQLEDDGHPDAGGHHSRVSSATPTRLSLETEANERWRL